MIIITRTFVGVCGKFGEKKLCGLDNWIINLFSIKVVNREV